MSVKIGIGSTVYHKDPPSTHFMGKGIVTNVYYDGLYDLDVYVVKWQDSDVEWEHTAMFLTNESAKEAANVG